MIVNHPLGCTGLSEGPGRLPAHLDVANEGDVGFWLVDNEVRNKELAIVVSHPGFNFARPLLRSLMPRHFFHYLVVPLDYFEVCDGAALQYM